MAVKESVLQALTENEGKYFSGGKLADDLGVSRAAVWKAVKALQEEGYRIDSVTGRGYCLTKEKAPLTEEGAVKWKVVPPLIVTEPPVCVSPVFSL